MRSLNSVTRSVPELGILTDQVTAGRAIVIRLSDQRAICRSRRACRNLPGFNGKRRLQHAYGQTSGDQKGYRSPIEPLWSICAEWPRRKGRGRCEKGPQTTRRGLCRSANALLSADRPVLRAACWPCARLPRLSWMHQAAESLGKTLLLRGESGDASVDLSLAEYRTRHRVALNMGTTAGILRLG